MRSPRHSASSKASSELLQQGYRYALSLTHHDARAQDILQDACVALLRSAGPWNRGYLFRTIRNRFIDLYRRELLAPVELMENAVPGRSADEGAAARRTPR